MENHEPDVTGLEGLGNSQSVSSIGEFLSLEELGLKPEDVTNNLIPLDSSNETSKTEKKEPVVLEVKGDEVIEPVLPELKVIEDNLTEGLETLDEDTTNSKDKTDPLKDDIFTGEVNYKSMLKDLISEGVLPEIDAFDTEDGEVAFEDMKIDKETLLSLIKQTQDGIREDLKTTTVDVEGISDFTKKLINIEKHGGDVQQALATYQQVKHPIESINLGETTGQKAMCYLRLQAQGIDDGIAKDLIKSYELQGVLEDKALESKEQLDNAFIQSIERQEQVALEEEKSYKAAIKTYRSTLDNVLKDQQVSDTHRRKLLDIATKQTESGDFELDSILDNFRKNPIDAADLLMFVTNKDEFIKKKSESLLKQERINTLKKVSVIPKGRSTLAVPEKGEKSDPFLLDLSKL